jgi:hypothetical protein
MVWENREDNSDIIINTLVLGSTRGDARAENFHANTRGGSKFERKGEGRVVQASMEIGQSQGGGTGVEPCR